jgi:hypothetical protein
VFYWLTDPALTGDQQDELGLDLGFEDQASAELWLGECFADLQALGIQSVSLSDGDEIVLGPMLLEE